MNPAHPISRAGDFPSATARRDRASNSVNAVPHTDLLAAPRFVD